MKKFEDERGIIEDLKVGKDWSVTYITFKKGAVRGNHYHKKTIQYDFIASGKLRCEMVVNGKREVLIANTGDMIEHVPGNAHAYEAIEDSEMISTCHGVRIGENYEEDTFRLSHEEKLL